MGWWEDRVQDFVAAISRGVSGFKLGPGVLGTIIPIVSVGVVALALVAYALSSNPVLALAGIVFILLFLAYVVERAFRYAEKNPALALLGGSELLELFKDQSAARDKALVVDVKPVVGGGSLAIVQKDDGSV